MSVEYSLRLAQRVLGVGVELVACRPHALVVLVQDLR